MPALYRKSSLEKLANPEQLDRAVKVTSPLSWLALSGALIIVAAIIIWSVFGSLPTVINANGVIVSADNSYAVSAGNSGVVAKLHCGIGEYVESGSTVATIRNSVGEAFDVKSGLSGVVSALLISEDSEVFPGAELYRITPDVAGDQILVCYVPYHDARTLKEGMSVAVYPSHVDNRSFGHMEAEIINVSDYATDTNNMQLILGANNLIVEQIVASGPVATVLCEIKIDPNSENGFYWTNPNGMKASIPNGSFSSAQIVISEDAPIKKLLG